MDPHDPQSVGAPPPPPAPSETPTNKDENMWAMLSHLAALVGFVIPFCGFAGPLVVWLMKKDTMPLVDDQAKESLNFQLTVLIAFVPAFILSILVCIFFPLLFVIGLYSLVMTIIAAMKANTGERYRYPLCLRLIK